ncbi:MAG TPA: DUF5996 family protein [Terriglobales bacterium]|nr:DUF5996 family protein [Terriglobales bacterium]
MPENSWPELPLEAWKDTYATLHMWTQIVGKIRLALAPHVNHWWQVPLYVNSCGLTSSAIPYAGRTFEVQFDFVEHQLVITVSDGQINSMPLRPQSVAAFYAEFMAALRSLGIEVRIWPMPVEIPNPIRFDRDEQHASYDRLYVERFWRILVLVDGVLKRFRSGFIGKHSPIHFFWGSFDLASTRFSGRRAPERAGADLITREAYSHEVISAGFWPGGGEVKGAAFYAYAAPEPNGFKDASVRPAKAFYSPLGEFLLMYDDVRQSANPELTLLEFLQSTYEAGANLGTWPRKELERAA